MILITGANGTFGSQVAKSLLNREVHHLRLASSSLEKLKSNFDGQAELVSFDWSKPETFASIFQGVKTAYLIAPPFSTTFDETAAQFIEVARKTRLKHLIVTTAYGMDAAEGTSGYKTEKLVKDSGIPYTILRPNFIFQNFINYDLESIKNGAIFYPAGTGKTSYISIEDVAEVSAEVLLHPEKYQGQGLTLTGSESLTHDEIAEIFSKELGKTIKYINPTEEEYKSTLQSLGVPAQVYDFMAVLYAAIKAGHMGHVTTTVKDITGQEPVSFREFVAKNKAVFNVPSTVNS
ncbi:SDR family oxidoreductase [Fulvivirga sp.]|uniref:SDR family oxidoreductase n=1 Tax=Fulvivirga sp. TaxID=1931237 RepID=UPI0032F049CC